MPELEFSDFMQKHRGKCFAIYTAPCNCPSEVTDMNGRNFPSPYQLLSDWCTGYLKKDWAIKQRNERCKDLLLVVQSSDDEQQLREILTISENSKATEAGNITYSAKYDLAEYKSMAGDLGYV